MTILTLAVALVVLLGQTHDNPLLFELTNRGLNLEGKGVVKFAPPTMPDGLDAEGQRRVLQRVAAPRRQVSQLIRRSIVAPFVLKITEASPRRSTKEPTTPCRRVDLWYVAHGKLASLSRKELLHSLVELNPTRGRRRLPADQGALNARQLRARGIKTATGRSFHERYLYNTFSLFDRVLLRTTRRVVITSRPDSLLIVAAIDSKFNHDAQFPNLWRSVKFDPQGSYSLGPPQTYTHSAAYTKVTRLHDPPGALFFEHHYVFAEPQGWFGGKNLLRSKLPLAIQHGVRKLRRQLQARAKAETATP